jgi:hypothetical protein
MREGYIVMCYGAAMRIEQDQRGLPAGGVLVLGSHATIFRTRARARAAVKRTTQYARAQGLAWPILDPPNVRIVPVRVERGGAG